MEPATATATAAAPAATLAGVAAEFPFLEREGPGGRPFAYLDAAATAQKPRVVLDAMTDHLARHNANIHRGVYPLAAESTARFEDGRAEIAALLGADPKATIFAKNATELINLVARTWGEEHVGPGDLVVLTQMEHHSNIVPWQMLAERREAVVAYVPIDDDGVLDDDAFEALLARGPKLVALAHVSNVLGTINPVADLVARAREAGAATLVDGCQAVPHLPVDVAEIGADFYVFTGHKVYGPTGVGMMCARREVLEAMPPFLGGGDMIKTVDFEGSTWNDLPWRFEAGTSPYVEAAGLAVAMRWLDGLGLDAVRAHGRELTAYALERIAEIPGLSQYGPTDLDRRSSVISFAVEGAHPHDVAEILARDGVCVRAGHHCAQPLMGRLGVAATSRASFAVHTTREDIDRLVAGLHEVRRVMRLDD